MVIWFNIRKAWDYLLTNKQVFTIRPNKKVNGLHRIRSNFLDEEERMHCTLNFIRELDMTEEIQVRQILQRYVPQSGFSTIEEWISAFPKRKQIMRLYEVKLCFLSEHKPIG